MILTALAFATLLQLPPSHPPVVAKPLLVDGGALPPNHPVVANHPSSVVANPHLADGGALPPNHPVVPSGAPHGEDLLKQLEAAGPDLKDRDKPFEVAVAMGKLYFGSARRPEAIEFLKQAQAKSDPARKTYLDLRKRAFASKTPPAGPCTESPSSLDEAHKRAKEQAKKDLPLALSCLKKALAPALEGDVLLGNALFLEGEKAAALAQYERVLEVADTYDDALFGEGLILLETKGEDVKSLQKAKNNFDRYVQIYPAGLKVDRARSLSARAQAAVNAGGMSKVQLQPTAQQQLPPPFANANQNNVSPPPLSREQMEAAQNIKLDADGEKAIIGVVEEAEAFLAKGQFQQALDNYKRVMPVMPNFPRAQAGMAWSLIGLNRQPMADRVWGVALSGDADAVDKLGDALKAKGDIAGAKKLWTKLRETRPDMAAKLDPKLK